jgi:hypothetical protein
MGLRPLQLERRTQKRQGGFFADHRSASIRVTPVDGLIGGLELGLIAGPIFALITLLTSEAMESRILPIEEHAIP